MLTRPSVLCSAKTANCPSRVASLVAGFPIPCLLPEFVSSVSGSLTDGSCLSTPGVLVSRFPYSSGALTRRQMALPSSRATPVDTCPAPGPRWSPDPLPSRGQDCGLPFITERRLYSSLRYPYGPRSLFTFEARSRGLHPRYTRLHTPPYGDARGFTTDLLAGVRKRGVLRKFFPTGCSCVFVLSLVPRKDHCMRSEGKFVSSDWIDCVGWSI